MDPYGPQYFSISGSHLSIKMYYISTVGQVFGATEDLHIVPTL